MHEALRDTPVYQEMARWAREEGFQEGLQQAFQVGFQLGLKEGLRQGILDVVIERFPELVRLVQKQITAVNEAETLRKFLVKMSVVQSVEEARRYLLEAGPKYVDELVIPDDILRTANISAVELRREIALLLFQHDKLTLGQASDFAGMSQLEFQRLLTRRQIAVHYDVQEYTDDLDTLRKFYNETGNAKA